MAKKDDEAAANNAEQIRILQEGLAAMKAAAEAETTPKKKAVMYVGCP